MVHGKSVEEIDGDDITHKGVEDMKCAIAFMHGVSFDDVELEHRTISKPDTSKFSAINDIGRLVFKTSHPRSMWRIVEALESIQNINDGNGFHEFLDHIYKGNIDEAIKFN